MKKAERIAYTLLLTILAIAFILYVAGYLHF